MRYHIAVLLIFALVNHAAQAADQQSRARQIGDAVHLLQKELTTANKDRHQMVIGVLNSGRFSVREGAAISVVDHWAAIAVGVAGEYSVVAAIYSLMVNDTDKATVLQFLRMLHNLADEELEIAINGINLDLPSLTTPALVSQSERTRDIVRKIQHTIRSWTP